MSHDRVKHFCQKLEQEILNENLNPTMPDSIFYHYCGRIAYDLATHTIEGIHAAQEHISNTIDRTN